MPSPSKAATLFLFTSLIVGVAAPAMAAETTSSEIVIVRPEDVVPDDLYAAAVRVIVEGVVDGDLIVFAAEDVVISGSVTGTVTAIAPTVTIDGSVGESVRAVASDIQVEGEIGEDLVAVGIDTVLGTESRVGGDVLAWVSGLALSGSVEGDLSGSQRRLQLGGTVAGEVDVSVGRLTVADSASVGGDLGYRSDREGAGLERAEVGGSVVHRSPLPPNIRVRALGLFGRLLLVLFLSMSALVIAYLWPERVRAAIERLERSPVRSWLVGASILLSPMLVLAIAGVILALAPPAAGFPLLAALVPLLLALLGIVLVAAVAAAVPAAGKAGALVFKRLDLLAAVLVGSVGAGILWLMPVIGWLVPVVLLPLGLGGWLGSGGDSSSVPETAA